MHTITDLIFRVSNSNSNKWFTLLHNTNNPAKGVYWWQRLAPLDPHFQRWLSGANLVNRQPRPNRDHREASQSSGRPHRNPVWPVRESDCVTSFKIRHSASITLGSSRNRPAECPSIACWETRHTPNGETFLNVKIERKRWTWCCRQRGCRLTSERCSV